MMKREEIEMLRTQVPCAAVLETAGFAQDVKESTRRAVKFRRSGEIIIVTHEGRGWFDPLSEAKGDVFALVTHLDHLTFPESIVRVAALVGLQSMEPQSGEAKAPQISKKTVIERWSGRRVPTAGSDAGRYLCWDRAISVSILRYAVSQGVLREGPYGSMWAAHHDEHGMVAGWEERGPEWRGFASGGTKVLFRLGSADGVRLCVTEAAIDAISLAAIEGMRAGSLYLSTGGGWSPTTEAALRGLLVRPGAQLVGATDANAQGDAFADRLRNLSDEMGCDWLRLRPPAEDWNDVLKERQRERREKRKGDGVPHSDHPRQGRLRPAEPALDPVERHAGGPEDVRKG
ncbi:DUF3991 domain-containing protein [Agrobacterium tumefaciens]